MLLDQLTVVQNLAMPFTLDIEPPPDEVQRQASGWRTKSDCPNRRGSSRSRTLDAPGSRARAARPARWRSIRRVLILEHASAGLSADEAAALGADIRAHRRAAAGRRLSRPPLDEAFARAVADRVLTLEPATGRLAEQGTRRWFRRLLG